MANAIQYSAFQRHGSYLVTVSADNRVSVWDADSSSLQHRLAEPDHLSANYTCLAVGPAVGEATARAAKDANAVGTIALGTERGVVTVWDGDAGKVVAHLGENGDGHSSRVTGLALRQVDAEGDAAAPLVLYSASDSEVLEWDVLNGKVLRNIPVDIPAISALALSPSGAYLLVAGTSIGVCDLSSGKGGMVGTYIGHTTPTTTIAFSDDGQYFASASSDRHASVWSLQAALEGSKTPSKKSKKRRRSSGATAPAKLIMLPAVSTHVEVRAIGADDYHIAITHSDGTASITRFQPSAGGAGSAPISPASRVFVGSRSSSSVLLASLPAATAPAASHEALVAFGSSLRPRMARVSYSKEGKAKDGSQKLKSKVKIAKPADESKEEVEEREGMNEAPGAKSGNEHVMSMKSAPLARTSLKEGDVDDLYNVVDGKVEDDLGTTDETLGERLAALTSAVDELGDSEEEEEEEAEASKQASQAKHSAGQLQNVSTLTSVLSQAIQMGDEAQIEVCLSVGNAKTIDGTVASLPTDKVIPFLTRIIQKFEARPNRGVVLVRWLRAVLLNHAAFLMSIPGLVIKLSGLYQAIDSRLAVFKKLLRLKGRLDLLLAQAHGSSQKEIVPEIEYVQDDGIDEGTKDDEEEKAEEGDADMDHASDSEDEDEDSSDEEDEEEQQTRIQGGTVEPQ